MNPVFALFVAFLPCLLAFPTENHVDCEARSIISANNDPLFDRDVVMGLPVDKQPDPAIAELVENTETWFVVEVSDQLSSGSIVYTNDGVLRVDDGTANEPSTPCSGENDILYGVASGSSIGWKPNGDDSKVWVFHSTGADVVNINVFTKTDVQSSEGDSSGQDEDDDDDTPETKDILFWLTFSVLTALYANFMWETVEPCKLFKKADN